MPSHSLKDLEISWWLPNIALDFSVSEVLAHCVRLRDDSIHLFKPPAPTDTQDVGQGKWEASCFAEQNADVGTKYYDLKWGVEKRNPEIAC
jgi:hypothetical protein